MNYNLQEKYDRLYDNSEKMKDVKRIIIYYLIIMNYKVL